MDHLLCVRAVTELVDSQSLFGFKGNGDIEVHIDFSEHSEGDCDDHRAVDYGKRPPFLLERQLHVARDTAANPHELRSVPNRAWKLVADPFCDPVVAFDDMVALVAGDAERREFGTPVEVEEEQEVETALASGLETILGHVCLVDGRSGEGTGDASFQILAQARAVQSYIGIGMVVRGWRGGQCAKVVAQRRDGSAQLIDDSSLVVTHAAEKVIDFPRQLADVLPGETELVCVRKQRLVRRVDEFAAPLSGLAGEQFVDAERELTPADPVARLIQRERNLVSGKLVCASQARQPSPDDANIDAGITARSESSRYRQLSGQTDCGSRRGKLADARQELAPAHASSKRLGLGSGHALERFRYGYLLPVAVIRDPQGTCESVENR